MLDISLKYFSKYMTVIYNMSIDRADKPWIGDRRFTECFIFDHPSTRSPGNSSEDDGKLD